jgi:hypothetical protein
VPKLKMYRTPIGFHDAYVAATSQKAALEAWGADANLFARGVAEQVDDPELTVEPLANPGTVTRRLRGTLDEQLAALPEAPAAKAPPARERKKAKRPRPSREQLDQLEADLAELQQRQAEEEQALARREAELASERRKLTERHRRELERTSAKLDSSKAAYEIALSKWREGQ